jgi:hypothetical protein
MGLMVERVALVRNFRLVRFYKLLLLHRQIDEVESIARAVHFEYVCGYYDLAVSAAEL